MMFILLAAVFLLSSSATSLISCSFFCSDRTPRLNSLGTTSNKLVILAKNSWLDFKWFLSLLLNVSLAVAKYKNELFNIKFLYVAK